MNIPRVLLTAFALTSISSPGATEIEKIITTCDGCHGDKGISLWSDMPTIAGIDAFVHSEAMYIYQDEARPCADSAFRTGDTSRAPTNMCDIAAQLQDDQIEALAAHYSGLPFVAARQKFDVALAAAGKAIHEQRCGVCHTSGGADPRDESSILAGQWIGYLRATIEQYRAGERDQPEKMQKALDALSADDIEALLNYYASQQ